MAAGGDKKKTMELVSKAADSIAEGDIVERSERATPFFLFGVRSIKRYPTVMHLEYKILFTMLLILAKVAVRWTREFEKFAKLLPKKELWKSSLAAKKIRFLNFIISINYPDRAGLALFCLVRNRILRF
jgi:hypothetical protein